MTLPASGALSLGTSAGITRSIVVEFGGGTPHSLSEYYRGGGLVPVHGGTSGIPASGTISFSDFHGKSDTAPPPPPPPLPPPPPFPPTTVIP